MIKRTVVLFIVGIALFGLADLAAEADFLGVSIGLFLGATGTVMSAAFGLVALIED